MCILVRDDREQQHRHEEQKILKTQRQRVGIEPEAGCRVRERDER
jgi:hypothetical protein